MEARHEAQMAALRATHSPTPGGQSVSFVPNTGFNEIKPFSGARGQDLLPFLQQLRSRANILKTPEDDVARELCLKLTGDALQAYNLHFTPDANPRWRPAWPRSSSSYWSVRYMAAEPPPSSVGTFACPAPSSARTSDWLRPGPDLRQPPQLACGGARLRSAAGVHSSARLRRAKLPEGPEPGQNQRPLVRRGHRPTNAGPRSYLRLPARRRRSGSLLLPSCPQGWRRRCHSSGRTGTPRGDSHPARGALRRSGALGMRGRRSLTSGRRRMRTRSTTRSTPSPRPCRRSWPRWRVRPSSSLGCGPTLP